MARCPLGGVQAAFVEASPTRVPLAWTCCIPDCARALHVLGRACLSHNGSKYPWALRGHGADKGSIRPLGALQQGNEGASKAYAP